MDLRRQPGGRWRHEFTGKMVINTMGYVTYLLTLLSAIMLQSAYADSATQGANTTYAERLGWPAQARVLILHVDDAGMSAESNRGTIAATTEGVANSFSVMMPTPWVPEIVEFIKQTPTADAGLHLTLTAEWDRYRWGPLAGQPAVSGLVDPEGALWPRVNDVVQHASGDEVAQEISAQLQRARTMGFEPTHLDSHMGTLFATEEYLSHYIALGVAEGIPIMFPGGHNFYATKDNGAERAGEQARATGRQIWAQGLPVLDDLHNSSYGWAREDKVDKYIEAVSGLKPGVTMMIMHCTSPSDNFGLISDSGPSRYGDLEAMLSPRFRQALEDEDIVLTTWRELMQRRRQADK